jgi:hypothetical protein
MKRTLQLGIAVLVLMGVAAAKDKPAYDLTGTLTGGTIVQPHSEGHLSAQGRGYDAYCYGAGANVTCTDTELGVRETLGFADGTWMHVFMGTPPPVVGCLDRYLCNDPLFKLMTSPASAFQYRLSTYKLPYGVGTEDVFCLPRTDKPSKEECYVYPKHRDGEKVAK